MSKLTKAVLAALTAGGNGVSVAQEGNQIQVMFAFSNNLVSKMQTLVNKETPELGARFDKENGVWNVPEALGDSLAAVVADMRDFNLNNGVQVKDVEGGGKQVFFDYNQQMSQVIGAVNGAEFDKKTRAWNVPADSEALVVKEGQSTSYLDMAVNKMRGIGIAFATDRDSIIELAKASPELAGNKIAPVYPSAGESYSGKMVSVNGNFAAQFTNTKDGVAFTVIHNLVNIGSVFKGDEVRIDYDAKLQADVRSADLFKKQVADRETLTAKAACLVDGAKVVNASIKDGSKYSGKVMGLTDNMILLSGGRTDFTLHRRDVLTGHAVHDGADVKVAYEGGKGAVIDAALKKEAQAVGR